MSATVYAQNSILDLCFGNIAYTPPASYWLGLSTTTIYADGSGATEPSGYGYARVELPNDKSTFSYSASGCVLNSGSISFPLTTGSWGTMTYAGLWSGSTGGSVLYFTALSPSVVIQNATVVNISACQLAISLT